MIRKNELYNLRKYIDGKDVMRLKKSAEKADELENKFRNKMKKYYSNIDEEIETSLMIYNSLDYVNFDITDMLMLQQFEVMAESIKIAEGDKKKLKKTPASKLAKAPTKKKKKATKKKARKVAQAKTPTSFAELMSMWDEWRQTRKPSKRVKGIADGVRKEYLKKTQQVWKKYAKNFLNGGIEQKRDIVKRVKEAGRTTWGRAKTIVETETTYYYNKTRKNIYDKSPDVTHYLYVAIRDAATTKWCKDRNGLVYEKGSEILKDETPPVHWNCRSELLPLTKQNPGHARLINDRSKQRANRKPAPLPPGWKGR